jgi:hypothetical protein
MKRKSATKEKRRIGKTVLRLPDLEVAKSVVLNSLSCPDAAIATLSTNSWTGTARSRVRKPVFLAINRPSAFDRSILAIKPIASDAVAQPAPRINAPTGQSITRTF